MCIVWPACEDGLISADGEVDASFSGCLGWGDGFPVLCNIPDVFKACFPAGTAARQKCCAIVDLGFGCCDTGIHCSDGLFVGFIDNGHPGLACGDDAFLDIGKEGTKGVEVTRRNRVELVVVALRASSRLTEPDGADGAHAVSEIAGFVVLGLSATFLGREEETVKGGADLGFLVGTREEVTGELFACEAVKGLVGVEGFDDVVAVRVDVSWGVGVVPDGVCKADDIQPVLRHLFAIVWACQQAVNEIFVGVRRLVVDESLNFGIGRWEAGQVKGQAPDEGAAVSLWAGLETDFGKAALDQKVDGMFAFRNRGLYGELIGPVLLVGCAFANPAPEGFFLRWRNGFVELCGGHRKGI